MRRKLANGYFDRRERLEKHEHESFTLLWLSVSEIETIIDNFDALEVVHGLTVDERVLRDDLIDWIGGGGVEKARDARLLGRGMADPDADRAEARLRDGQAGPQRDQERRVEGEPRAVSPQAHRRGVGGPTMDRRRPCLRARDPRRGTAAPPQPLNGRARRRREMPTLDYDPRRGEQQ